MSWQGCGICKSLIFARQVNQFVFAIPVLRLEKIIRAFWVRVAARANWYGWLLLKDGVSVPFGAECGI